MFSTHIKFDMQSARFPVKLFSNMNVIMSMKEASLFAWKDVVHGNGDFQNLHDKWIAIMVMDNLWLLKRKKIGHVCTPTSSIARGGGGFLYFLSPPSPLKKRGKGEREGGGDISSHTQDVVPGR